MSGSPATRVGHQGLFAERLDADTQANPQAAGGTVAWHNRQRTLLSEYGRFLQRDPHATGVTVPQTLWWHSGDEPIESASSGRVQPSMMAMLLPNQYQYVLSHPGGLVDPTGGFPVDPRQAARIPGPGEVAMRGARMAGRGTAAIGDRLGAAFIHAERRAGTPVKGRGVGSVLGLAKEAGRAVGATYAALALDGTLSNNRAYNSVIRGTFFGASMSGLGAFGDVRFGTSVAGVLAGVGSSVGAFAMDGWNVNSTSGWGATLAAASEFRLEVEGAITPIVAAAAMGAAFYSGAIEYAAESAFDWWK